jgi:predicted DNA-binding protein (UPF0251 family)/predicted Fe-Mo cluster-binding NifX family protein
MPRPFKNRKINGFFDSDCFKPNGIPVSMLADIELSVDELEALRLADLEGMYQNDAAKKMGVSRQTFGNIVKRARQKTADAIINAKALKIVSRGFSYSDALRQCESCGLVWRNSKRQKQACPVCRCTKNSIPSEAYTEERFFKQGICRLNARDKGQNTAKPATIKGDRKMKLVFASTGQNLESELDQRFGRCSYFVCYDTESGQVTDVPNTQNLNAAQGAGIQAATTVAECGADYAFCGHCGPKAFRVLQAAGVKVICGVKGKLDDLVKEFEAGNLKAADSADVEGHWV